MEANGISKPMAFLEAARKAAGYATQAEAAEHVPYARVTIGRHERGEIQLAPEDLLVYAQAYNAPEILFEYCRVCCPIGRRMMRPAQADADLTLLVTQLGNRLRKISAAAERLADIADDNKVDAAERADFDRIVDLMRNARDVLDDFERYALLQGKKSACSGAGRVTRAVPAKGTESVYSNYNQLAGARQ